MAKYDYIELAQKGKLTEKEIKALLKFVNNNDNKKLVSGVMDEFWDNVGDRGEIELEKAQEKKGLDWMKNYHFKKNGELKTANNLSGWENDILRDSHRMTLTGFYDGGGFMRSYWLPQYNVESKEGNFDYVMQGGKIKTV